MKLLKKLTSTKLIPFLYLGGATVWLRLVNLGYSDYQGDEIKALFRPSDGQTALEFLFSQRKGPIQFFVTYLMSLFDPTYMNQFLLRLPFALAGILAIYFFYKLVKMHFGDKIALYASLFVSMNGIFVAFSRLVQYQSFTILFFILALYFFTLTIKKPKWEVKGWYWGMVFWALSILAHYDGGFIALFALYILVTWYKQSELSDKIKRKHILFSGLIFAAMLAVFFVPYVFHISDSTKLYWANRLTSSGGKISSSIVTFQVYNPLYVLPVFSGLILLSFVKIRKSWPVVLWAVFPLVVWELITDIPGTHIYNYLLPGAILAAFGITVVEDLVTTVFKPLFGGIINKLGLMTLFIFMLLLSHVVFVNNTIEYPWVNAKFGEWSLNRPSPLYHLSMFGFPYNRGWEEIGEYVMENSSGYFSTNERKSIPRFYVPLPKDTTMAGHYISIENPQSFSPNFTQEKAKYWGDRYKPVKIITVRNKVVARIYFMEQGDLVTIKALGF